MAKMTVTLARDTTGLTPPGTFNEAIALIPVPRIDEFLKKKTNMMKAMDKTKTVVHDHLQHEHLFVLHFTAITPTTGGGDSAWTQKREFIQMMQEEGRTWKFFMEDTDRGIAETYYVVCKSVNCVDMAGGETSVKMTITLIETDNWEGIP